MSEIKVEWYFYPEQEAREDDDYFVSIHTDELNYVRIGRWNSCIKKFKDPNLEAVYTSEHTLMKDTLWNKWYNCCLNMFDRCVIAWAKIPKSYESSMYLN